jgi:hypothetical protein
VECFEDGGDDWIAPAELAGEIAGARDSAAGARTVTRGRVRKKLNTEFTESTEVTEKSRE